MEVNQPDTLKIAKDEGLWNPNQPCTADSRRSIHVFHPFYRSAERGTAMRKVFFNNIPISIERFRPTNISSVIPVDKLGGTIERVTVVVNITHSYTADLHIFLVAPDGKEIALVEGQGGSGDNYYNTVFDDGSSTSIASASPPFTGVYRPEEPLSTLNGIDPDGQWTLKVRDDQFLDGGFLNGWGMALVAGQTPAPAASFDIDVRFLGGLSPSQRSVFAAAAARWSDVIIGDLPSASVGGDVIDDVRIDASGISIDGPLGTLGRAGPTRFRPGTLLPVTGIMEFDIGDLNRMEFDGSLLNVIIHEMGHVLGIGTLWNMKGLLQGSGTSNPIITGTNAMREFATLIGSAGPIPVPAANTGGPGTREGHFRESIFGNELMTGYLDPGINPISRLTVGALQDLGYQVDYDSADPFSLPSALELAMMGIGAEGGYGHRQCAMCVDGKWRINAEVLPQSAMVD